MRLARAAVALIALPLTLAGCGSPGTGDGRPAASVSPGPSTGTSTAPSPTASSPAPAAPAPPRAAAVRRPAEGACYRLDFDEAVAPTGPDRPVDCARPHTSVTYAVGTLDNVVDGHLLAVDSRRLREQVAGACPARLSDFLGGTVHDQRLSMLRAVWFTPSVRASDAGADWYRCDVIAVASDGRLATLTGALRGVLDRPEARAGYGMCGTAEPGTAAFSRVICSGEHAWRAIRTVAIPGRGYPGEDAARRAGQQPCQDAARDLAADPLSFRWGYEWPTARQWRSGQVWGLCWVPD